MQYYTGVLIGLETQLGQFIFQLRIQLVFWRSYCMRLACIKFSLLFGCSYALGSSCCHQWDMSAVVSAPMHLAHRAVHRWDRSAVVAAPIHLAHRAVRQEWSGSCSYALVTSCCPPVRQECSGGSPYALGSSCCPPARQECSGGCSYAHGTMHMAHRAVTSETGVQWWFNVEY